MTKMTDAKAEASRKYDAKRAGKRKSNWAFLVYPESAKEGWLGKLETMCVPAFVSPLHDQDTWTEADEEENAEHVAGEPKKAHYHVMVMFSAVKTYEQANEFAEELGGTKCTAVNDRRAYARYLCHLGCESKVQYSIDDVRQFGGADYAEVAEGTTDKVAAIAEMETFAEEQGIDCYATLSKYARENRRDWYRILVGGGGRHIKDFMQSMTWEAKRDAERRAGGLDPAA